MLVKTFKARTCSEALGRVRDSLGEGAAILETRRLDVGVEVVAAAERPEASRRWLSAPRGAPAAEAADRLPWLVESLETRGFSSFLAERIAAAARSNLDDEGLADEGRVFGYAREILALWLDGAEGGAESARRLQVMVGPPGVGKTTSIAKLAAQRALRGGERVVLASADHERLGGAEQLEGFARLLEVPFLVVRHTRDLQRACELAGEDGTVYLDTPGVSRHAGDTLDKLGGLLEGVGPAEVTVLLAADHDAETLGDALRRFARLRPSAVGATRTDEAVRRGALVTALARSRLPLRFVGNGPGIPDDIETADARRLAAWALPLPKES